MPLGILPAAGRHVDNRAPDLDLRIEDPEADSWYGGRKYRHIVWPQAEFDWMMRNVAKDDVVFDIGAHQGVWAIVFAKLASEGHVIAFETSPFNLTAARKNVSRNKVDNVTLENLCVGATLGEVLVTDDSGGVVAMAIHKPKSVLKLRQTTVDNYGVEAGVTPTLVKIDVEGYEIEVLRGMRETLNRTPKLMLELTNLKFVNRLAYVREVLQHVDLGAYSEISLQYEVGGDMVYLRHAGRIDIDRLAKANNPHLYFA